MCLWRFTSTKGGRVLAEGAAADATGGARRHVFDLSALAAFEDPACKVPARVKHVELLTGDDGRWRRAGGGDSWHRAKVLHDGKDMTEPAKSFHGTVGGLLPGGFRQFTAEPSWGGSSVTIGVEPGSRVTCWAFQVCASCTMHIAERFPLAAKVDFKVGAGAVTGGWRHVGRWGEPFLDHNRRYTGNKFQDEAKRHPGKREKRAEGRLDETKRVFRKKWGKRLPGPECAPPAQDPGLYGGCWRFVQVEPGKDSAPVWMAPAAPINASSPGAQLDLLNVRQSLRAELKANGTSLPAAARSDLRAAAGTLAASSARAVPAPAAGAAA